MLNQVNGHQQVEYLVLNQHLHFDVMDDIVLFVLVHLFIFQKTRNKIDLGFVLFVVPRFFPIDVVFDGGVGNGLRSAICVTLGDCGLD